MQSQLGYIGSPLKNIPESPPICESCKKRTGILLQPIVETISRKICNDEYGDREKPMLEKETND